MRTPLAAVWCKKNVILPRTATKNMTIVGFLLYYRDSLTFRVGSSLKVMTEGWAF